MFKLYNKKQTINCHGNLIDLSNPHVMGVINITPDSFYDGGRYNSQENIIRRVKQCEREGASMIDLGAYSSRPGAQDISPAEEKKRLDMALSAIRKEGTNLLVSVDTFRSDIASWAVNEYKVDMINDISAGDLDDKMFDTMAKLQVPYVMMHMQGTPQNMQNNPVYADILAEIIKYFSNKLHQLRAAGVKDIIADPGFGFGKSLDHNYQLFNGLGDVEMLEIPILIGVSRKSMLQKLLSVSAEDALNGTTVLHTLALKAGVNILRVHDVKEAVQTVTILDKLSSTVTDNS